MWTLYAAFIMSVTTAKFWSFGLAEYKSFVASFVTADMSTKR